jgi:hypothetical protein
VALLASAVAVVLAVLPARDDDRVRSMGSLSARLYLRHGEVTREIGDGAAVTRGDAVRVVVIAPSAGYLAAFFMDDAGGLTWLVPPEPRGEALPIGAGEVLLPGSAVFDGSPRPERLFLVKRAESFRPADVATQIVARWRASGLPLAAHAFVPAEVYSVLFTKEMP